MHGAVSYNQGSCWLPWICCSADLPRVFWADVHVPVPAGEGMAPQLKSAIDSLISTNKVVVFMKVCCTLINEAGPRLHQADMPSRKACRKWCQRGFQRQPRLTNLRQLPARWRCHGLEHC